MVLCRFETKCFFRLDKKRRGGNFFFPQLKVEPLNNNHSLLSIFFFFFCPETFFPSPPSKSLESNTRTALMVGRPTRFFFPHPPPPRARERPHHAHALENQQQNFFAFLFSPPGKTETRSEPLLGVSAVRADSALPRTLAVVHGWHDGSFVSVPVAWLDIPPPLPTPSLLPVGWDGPFASHRPIRKASVVVKPTLQLPLLLLVSCFCFVWNSREKENLFWNLKFAVDFSLSKKEISSTTLIVTITQLGASLLSKITSKAFEASLSEIIHR